MKKLSKFLLIIPFALALSSCKDTNPFSSVRHASSENNFATEVAVGYKLLNDKVERDTPDGEVGELSNYPNPKNPWKNDSTWPTQEAIASENKKVLEDEHLNVISNQKLNRWKGSDGLYTGDNVPSDSLAVSMQLSIGNIAQSNVATGLYAAPGEMIEITMPDYYDETSYFNNIYVVIGQCSQRQKYTGEIYNGLIVNDIPNSSINKSVPYRTTAFFLKDIAKHDEEKHQYEGKFGSPLGGPIYVGYGTVPPSSFDVTITGAVLSPFYQYGFTTEEEWEMRRNAPGQYCDFVTDRIRLSGPATSGVRSNLNMDQVLEFYNKVQRLGSYWDQTGTFYYTNPITQIHDYYIHVGAAVAHVNRNFSYLPVDWLAGTTNLDNIMSGDIWGEIHELNHHHQLIAQKGWGFASGNDETTNNFLNAVAYSMYTNCAKGRNESGGLSGWKYVSDPYYTMKKTLEGWDQLSFYVDLYHKFGLEAVNELKKGTFTSDHSADAVYKAASIGTGYDLYEYLKAQKTETWNQITEAAHQEIKDLGLETYHSISSLYTKGIFNTKKITNEEGKEVEEEVYNETGKPYMVSSSSQTVLDFNKYTVGSTDFTFKSLKQSGKALVKTDQSGVYIFNPSKANNQYDFIVTFNVAGKEVKLKGTLEKDSASITANLYDTSKNAVLESIPEGELKDLKKEKIEYISSRTASIPNFDITDEKLADPTNRSALAEVIFDLHVPETDTYDFSIASNAKFAQIYFDKGLGYTFGNVTNNYANSDHCSIKLKKNQKVRVSLYVYTTGNKVSAKIGWRNHANVNEEGELEDFSDIGSNSFSSPGMKPSNFYLAEVNSDFLGPNWEYKSIYRANIDSVNTIAVLPSGTFNEGANIGVMSDGNQNTFIDINVSKNNFPYSVVFENTNKFSFNHLTIKKRRHQNAGIGEYKLKGSDQKDSTGALINPVTLYEGTAAYSNYAFEIDFDKHYNYQYLMIEVYSTEKVSSGSTNVFTISDFALEDKLETDSFYYLNTKNLKYSGKWNYVPHSGTLNSLSCEGESKATLEFTFNGSAIGFMGRKGPIYGSAKVNIDGKIYTIDSSSETFKNRETLLNVNLEKGKHKVKITVDEGSLINLSSIGIIPGSESNAAGTIVLTIFITLLVIAAILGITYAVLSNKNIIKLTINRKKKDTDVEEDSKQTKSTTSESKRAVSKPKETKTQTKPVSQNSSKAKPTNTSTTKSNSKKK